jgi:putative hydrolase of the HAD superfamily
MPGKTPQAVIFDFGGVLCFHPPDEKFNPIAEIFGLKTADLIPLFWANRAEYDAGRLDAWTYWNDIGQAAGKKKLAPGILGELTPLEVALWNDYDERALSWAAHLRASGFRTGILSNLPPALGAELRATPGFLDPFDHVTFSFELKSIKPEPEIYQDAIRGLGVAPGEALFLDDRPDNVEGARAVGMMAEVFGSWEEFLATQLERYHLPAPALDEASAR